MYLPTRLSRPWSITLGIFLMVLGLLSFYVSIATTLVTVFFIGWMCITAGLFQLGFIINSEDRSELWGSVLIAFLYIIAGTLLALHPIAGEFSLTTFIGFFFLVSGFSRFLLGTTTKYGGRGWAILSSLVTVFLGAYILVYLSDTRSFVLGILVAGDIFFFGVHMIVSKDGVLLEKKSDALKVHPTRI
jgi:uncharacterized membrane protein HdeD (DUF308 family)